MVRTFVPKADALRIVAAGGSLTSSHYTNTYNVLDTTGTRVGPIRRNVYEDIFRELGGRRVFTFTKRGIGLAQYTYTPPR